MKLSCVILIFLFFLPSTCWCQTCADSSYHLRYNFPTRFDAQQQFQLNDGGRLIQGRLQSSVPGLVISRFGKDNEILWSKKIMVSPPYTNTPSVKSVIEASNGNIVVTGFMEKPGNRYDFYFAFFSSEGNILSQRVIKFPSIINYDDRYKISTLMCKKGSDSLLLLFSVDWYGSDPLKMCLIVTDNNGTVGSTKVINLPESSYAVEFVKAGVSLNQLTLYGSAYHNNSCDVYNNTGSSIKLKIDLVSNQILQQKSFCLPTAGGKGFVGYSPNYISSHSYDVFGFHQNGFLLKNGGIALTRAYQRFTTLPDTTNWLFMVSYFDSLFNPVKSEYITTGNLFQNRTIQEVLIDSIQNKYFYFTDYNLKRTYYALADSEGILKLQKKIDIAPLETQNQESRLNILVPDALLSISTLSVSSDESHIDFFKLLQKDTASSCFGTGTSFLSFKPAQLSQGTWGAITVRNSEIIATPAGLSTQDYVITKEVICVKRHVCDVLKLNTPGVVCDISQPVKVSATKNRDCEGKIAFSFDTSSVANYSQPDDTTLLISFSKDWNGKIYASAFSCPSLKDSVILNVSTPMPELNLGKDTVLCKGATLQLTAPDKFKAYRWQDGSTTNTFTVARSGRYFLAANDYCGRIYSDTINVSYSNSSIDLDRDIEICMGEEKQLKVASHFQNYNWQPAYNIRNADSDSPIVFPYRTTTYHVQATDSYNCVYSDSVVVTVDTCEINFFVPSAFTPNSDGKNDLFRPVIKGGLMEYQLSVYNRWGQLIFTTRQPKQGWNGKVNNAAQSTGIYIWVCSYQFYNDKPRFKKGTVLLVR